MKSRSILTTGLLTVILLVACSPAVSPAPSQPEATARPVLPATEPPASSPSAQVEPQSTQTETPTTVAPTEIPQIIATSRGPDLEATDPSTVSLASGELQLVEFFRFT